MKPMIWAHADCLSRSSNIFRRYPGAASVFVVDPDQLGLDHSELMRIGFLYESALDLGCEIRRGDTTSELLWAARAEGCDTIITTESHDPAFERVCNELRKSVKVLVIPQQSADDCIDIRQFAGYWKKPDAEIFPRA